METVKVYIGTDPFMRKAEVALAHSIRKHVSGPCEIIWMDYSRGGIWANWNIGRARRQPYSEKGWATDFTCFRFAIPEANGFKGRAIYLDVDMVLLKDIRELFEYPMEKPVMIPDHWDVILYDCAAFKEFDWWPSIEEMKPSGTMISAYKKLLESHDVVSKNLPRKWDCRDGAGYDPKETALIHYTEMRTQPWKPYPQVFDYPEHPSPEMVKIFWDLYEEGSS
ncbi:MAG: hypothetical protein KDK48_00480 [Chlamydiia bacterium]|nr:hypothetical protein [Chlamydiia bacterium]